MFIIGITTIANTGDAGVGPLLGDGVKTTFVASTTVGAPISDFFNKTTRQHWEVARITCFAPATNAADIYIGGPGFDIATDTQGVALSAREGLPPIGVGAFNCHDIGQLDVGADAAGDQVITIIEVI